MKDLVIGVPVKLGKNGVDQVMEIKLTDSEKAELNKSADDVKANLAKVKLS
jgi:malate dehydrogenase